MLLATLTAVLLSADPGAVELELSAERVVHDGAKALTTAEGQAQLRTAGAVLDAERIVYDKGRQAATAVGSVSLRLLPLPAQRGEVGRRPGEGQPIIVTADVVTVRFEGDEVREVYILDGVALAKKGVTPEALEQARTPAAARALGKTVLRLEGNHLTRDGPRWTADALTLVPCDCDFEHPSWKVRSSTATLDTEAERISVLSPTVWVKGVPVLWLPWLSLPTTDRQTGLLFPHPSFTALNGFGLEQPVFVTLGRSADVTLTPGLYTGGGGVYGVQGPRLGAELRYAPSRRTSGQATVGLLYDFRPQRDPVVPTLTTGRARGWRGEASWQHAQDFGGGAGVRVDASAHSDGYWQRDLVTDVIAREAGYLRSAATLFHRGADHLLGLDVVLRQDLQWGYDALGFAPSVAGSTAPRFGPATLQRLPGLQFSLPLKPLAGPLAFSLEASAVRHSPLWTHTGDEGAAANEGRGTYGRLPFDAPVEPSPPSVECLRQQLYFPFASPGGAGPLLDPGCITAAEKAGQGDRLYQPGEREARLRLDVLPRLSLAAAPGDAVSLSAWAGWRQGVWLGEVTGRTSHRGYPVLGARAATELARRFEGPGLRHAIEPAVELRAVPVVVGTQPDPYDARRVPVPAPYDEVDTAIPDLRPRAQAVAELRQRLTRLDGREVLRLDLGQGVALVGPDGARAAESYGAFSATLGPLRAGAGARLDPLSGQLTRLSASLGLDVPRGGASLAYDELLDDGTNRARAPLDLLFGDAAGASSTSRAQLLTAGARWRLGDFALRYDAVLFNRAWPQPDGSAPRPLSLTQHTLSVAWTPACDCWRVEAYATQRLSDARLLVWPDLGLTLTVSRLGSLGTGG